MAFENAKKFLTQVSKDEALRARVMEKEPAGVAAMAKELGFDLTPEELTAAMKAFKPSDGSGPQELTVDEMEQTAGGKPHLGEGIIDFFSWVACGFNHHYVYTGKTKQSIDLVFHVTFYEQKCADCGHYNWTRTAPPDVKGPKIGNP